MVRQAKVEIKTPRPRKTTKTIAGTVIAARQGGKRSHQCSICARPDRAVIDKFMLETRNVRMISEKFGIGRGVIQRHSKHIGALIVKKDNRLAGSLMDKLGNIEQRLNGLALIAEQQGQVPSAIVALRELRETLRLIHDMMPRHKGAVTLNVVYVQGRLGGLGPDDFQIPTEERALAEAVEAEIVKGS
jgi:ribosomal protein S14